MDRIKLCPEPSMTKEARERTKPKSFVFPKEKARVQARVHAEYPGVGAGGQEKKAEAAVTEDAVDKLAAALALGTTLAEDDLLGLRKRATEIAGRLMAKNSMEQAPQNPNLPTGGGTFNPPPAAGGAGTPPPRQPPGPPQELQGGGLPKISTEQAPASPGLPPTAMTPRTPPPPPMTPGPPPETQQGQPKISSHKFAEIMESTRQRMLRALVKSGQVG